MKLKKTLLLFLPVMAVLLAAVICLKNYYVVNMPEVKSIRDFSIESITRDSVEIATVIKVFNPNHFDIDAGKAQLEITNFHKAIGRVSIEKAFRIPANAASETKVKIKISSIEIFELMSRQKDTISGRITGTMKASALFTNHSISVNIPYSFPVNDCISGIINSGMGDILETTGTSANLIGSDKLMLVYKFRMRAIPGLNFELVEFPSAIMMSGRKLGVGYLLKPVLPVSQSSSGRGELIFILSDFSITDYLNAKQLQYEIRGILKIKIADRIIEIPYISSIKF